MKTYDEFLELFTKENKEVVVPAIRDSGIRLVARAKSNPCEVCSRAEYNKLCTDAPHCAALIYHTMSKLGNMVGAFFSKDSE